MNSDWKKILDKEHYEVYSKNGVLKYKCKLCEYFILVNSTRDGVVFITAHLKKFHEQIIGQKETQ
jgi:hypothetical protein